MWGYRMNPYRQMAAKIGITGYGVVAAVQLFSASLRGFLNIDIMVPARLVTG
jgi:hypothetical protein